MLLEEEHTQTQVPESRNQTDQSGPWASDGLCGTTPTLPDDIGFPDSSWTILACAVTWLPICFPEEADGCDFGTEVGRHWPVLGSRASIEIICPVCPALTTWHALSQHANALKPQGHRVCVNDA